MWIGLTIDPATMIAQAESSYLSLTLKTQHYHGKLTEHCIEDVACNHVTLDLRLADGKLLKLYGRRTVAMCADGVTPCHPLGYTFNKPGTRFEVSDEGELRIIRRNQIVISEPGTLERASASERTQ